MADKITDKKIYEEIIAAVAGERSLNLDPEMVSTWAQRKISQIDNKAERARETAAAKRADPDELTNDLLHALTDDYSTIGDIATRLSYPTRVAKIAYRLNNLSKDPTSGVEKGKVVLNTNEGRNCHLVAYRRV